MRIKLSESAYILKGPRESHGRGHSAETGEVPHGTIRCPLPEPEPDEKLLAELPGSVIYRRTY